MQQLSKHESARRVRTRCFKAFHAYRDNEIDYAELKRRLKVIDDELKTKQTSLKLKEKGEKP